MSHLGTTCARIAAAALVLPLLAASALAAGPVYDVEALTLVGDPLPGSSGATFLSVDGTGNLAVNDAGEVVHGGIVSGGTVSCPSSSWCWGVYLATADGVSDVILEGDAAPGTTEVFDRLCSGCPPLQYVSLSADGDVAFGGWFGSGGSAGTGAFVDHHLTGLLSPVALSGTTAPDTEGGTYTHVLGVSMNDARTVGHRSAITGGSVTEGLFSSLDGYTQHQALALTGQAAPDTGGTFSGFPVGPRLSDDEAAFTANVSGGSATGGVFAVDLVSLTKRAVALQGASAPNTGGSYGTFVGPAINASGDVAFEASVTGGTSAGGIFLDDGSTQTDVVLLGDPAPGTGATFLALENPAINANGDVAFVGRYDAGGDNGVFLWTNGTLVPIALTGEDAPDTGGTYSVFGNRVAISDSGKVAFLAVVSGGSSGGGIFLASRAYTGAIDFETRGDGSPITTTVTIPGNDWSNQGVVFTDSTPSTSYVQIETSRSFSVPTTFSTNFLSVTVGASTAFVELDFADPVTHVELDFLVREPDDLVTVTAYDASDTVLTSFDAPATETLANPRISDEGGGHVVVSGVGVIARLRVEADTSGGVLGIDNVDFLAITVPALPPAGLLLLGAGLLATGARRLARRERT